MKKDQIVNDYQGNEIIYEVNETEAMEQTDCSNSNIINRSSVQRMTNNQVRASNVSDITQKL